MQRRGQKLLNKILEEFRDIGSNESAADFLDERGRFLDSRLFNMSDEEFWNALEEVEDY